MSPRLWSLLVGIGLAAVLLVVLTSGVFSPSSSAEPDVEPGITTASASLLNLDVFSHDVRELEPNFHLVDQYGQETTLRQFRGKVVVWSLNDDQCTDLCALFAQDVIAADHDLGSAARDVVFVSVNANPFYSAVSYVKKWSVEHRLEPLRNWYYVTGTPSELKRTWQNYHVTVKLDRANKTVAHDASVQFVSPDGELRALGDFTLGSISTAYYAHAMAQMADDLLPPSEQAKVGGTSLAAPQTKGATVGDKAPGFSLESLTGTGRVTLSTLEGRPLVLNFWASTCTVCNAELPALEATYDAFRKKVTFVGDDVAEPAPVAAAYARSHGLSYLLASDPKGEVAASYRVDALPVTFIIGADGKIIARHVGRLNSSELEAVLQMDFPNLPQLSS